MTTDPWQHMLLAIEPTYFKWKDVMEHGPRIAIEIKTLSQVTWKLQMHIVERWPSDTGVADMFTDGSGKLDERCKWASEQLESWPNCKRVAWDRWEFKHLHDAQKFKTLFMLKWDQ